MSSIADILQTLRQFGQEHLLLGYDNLPPAAQAVLARQIAGIDFERLRTLYAGKDAPTVAISEERVRPIPAEQVSAVGEATAQLGRDALARGEVAVLLVAGGQGSRLGFERPKGMFPIGPVTDKTLFQIHAEKVLALSRKYGKPIPLLIMTSSATHDETVAFFKEHDSFGLPEGEVYYFQQGTMPALDLETGQVLLERPGVVFASPNGHGGTLAALADTGLLDILRFRNFRHLFYFQVDNPLVNVCDPRFLGRHIETASQASSKAIAKAFPDEKMGVFALLDGKCTIIEYSDMPKELKHSADGRGELLHRAGSPAIHLFDLGFLSQLTQKGAGLPFHLARKKVPHVNANGIPVQPTTENALKFEMFIFDALPMAERWLVLEAPRGEEFAPVKNAYGVDSPQTCRQAQCDLYGSWLEANGVGVPRDADGKVALALEISPLFALSAEDLKGRIPADEKLNRPMYWE